MCVMLFNHLFNHLGEIACFDLNLLKRENSCSNTKLNLILPLSFQTFVMIMLTCLQVMGCMKKNIILLLRQMLKVLYNHLTNCLVAT